MPAWTWRSRHKGDAFLWQLPSSGGRRRRASRLRSYQHDRVAEVPLPTIEINEKPLPFVAHHQSSPAKARRLDRIRNSIFSGCNENAEGENPGRPSRSPILIGPVSRCHLRENEERRDALVVHRRLERCIL